MVEVFLNRNRIKQTFRIRHRIHFRVLFVRLSFDKRLGQFLRKQRGGMTFVQFSRKTGLPASTLFRLENSQQSITLGKLELVLKQQPSEAMPD